MKLPGTVFLLPSCPSFSLTLPSPVPPPPPPPRAEAVTLRDQLSESFARYEKLKLKYEEVCQRLETEIASLAEAKTKISSLETELEELIEIVRKDMAHRCISKNAAEDLLTLSSQMISRERDQPQSSHSAASAHGTGSDIFLHQFDWQALHLQLSVDMTEAQVIELKQSLSAVKSSYDILCSRLFLECQARVELEKILTGTKEDLESIKTQVLSEVKIRKQVTLSLSPCLPLSCLSHTPSPLREDGRGTQLCQRTRCK
jgi:hypothetical protein